MLIQDGGKYMAVLIKTRLYEKIKMLKKRVKKDLGKKKVKKDLGKCFKFVVCWFFRLFGFYV